MAVLTTDFQHLVNSTRGGFLVGYPHPTKTNPHPQKITGKKISNLRNKNAQILKISNLRNKNAQILKIPNPRG